MVALGAGLLAGPAIGGALAEAVGLTGVLYGAGAAVATVIALAPREPLGGGIAAHAREGLRCGW